MIDQSEGNSHRLFNFPFGPRSAKDKIPMIQPNCRARFTAEDFSFVVRVLGRNQSQSVSLVDLLTDPEARDDILDHEALARAVLENPGNLVISPQFYFYILARLVLRRTQIDDRTMADYLAALLEKFSQMRQWSAPVEALQTAYLSDLLAALKNASSYQTFLIRAYLGNYSLFLTGIFYENVESRRQRGAPSCSFYEELGRTSFRTAASHDVAKKFQLTDLFEKLAEQFHDCRLALNRLADELFDLGDHRYAQPIISL
jgi:hypothetical protein